jgi:hypothetical protein
MQSANYFDLIQNSTIKASIFTQVPRLELLLWNFCQMKKIISCPYRVGGAKLLRLLSFNEEVVLVGLKLKLFLSFNEDVGCGACRADVVLNPISGAFFRNLIVVQSQSI